MPIIASETIHIDVKPDKSIEIKFLKELDHRRCINIQDLVSVDSEKEQLHNIVKKLVGEGVIECTGDTCCISESYYNLAKRLRSLER